MNIAFAILAHRDPELVSRLVQRLLDCPGAVVALHYDANAPQDDVERLRALIGERARVVWADRVAVSWGRWSMVQATLNLLDAVARCGAPIDYVHLMSGADYPIAPHEALCAFLREKRGCEFIESEDPTSWIVLGMDHDRWQFRHPVGWKGHPRLAHVLWAVQKKLRLKRSFPAGLTPRLGSQWWTLTWDTCVRIRDMSRDRALVRFFRTVWIPDEMYFQTLVHAVAPAHRIAGHSLTFSRFSDYGVPVVYHDGHDGMLAAQPFFFARKLSPDAHALRDALDAACARKDAAPRPRTGAKADEYERWRLAARAGRPGRRAIGRVADPALGDLSWNKVPYLVVTGASRHALRLAWQRLARLPGLLCHGELFAEDRIEFAAGAERHAGFLSRDVALRDDHPLNALVQIVQDDPGRLAGFLLRFGDDRGILRAVIDDPNARIIAVGGDPLAEYFGDRSDPGAASHMPPVERYVGHYARFLEFRIEQAERGMADASARFFDWFLDDADGVCPRELQSFLGLVPSRPTTPSTTGMADPKGTRRRLADTLDRLRSGLGVDPKVR